MQLECSGQNLSNSSCQFWNGKSIPLKILHYSSLSWHNFCKFSVHTFSTLDKGSHQIQYNFETFQCSCENLPDSSCHFPNCMSAFLKILLHHSSVSWRITSLYFFNSNNIYFGQKEPIKVQNFKTFECSGQNLSNYLCQFWNGKPIPLQILHYSSLSWYITPQ